MYRWQPYVIILGLFFFLARLSQPLAAQANAQRVYVTRLSPLINTTRTSIPCPAAIIAQSISKNLRALSFEVLTDLNNVFIVKIKFNYLLQGTAQNMDQ